jgi:SAM-dependent methyltransferase
MCIIMNKIIPIKIKILKEYFHDRSFKNYKVLDIGGTYKLCKHLENIFKASEFYILNANQEEIKDVKNSFIMDAENLTFDKEEWDIITSFDVIEHLKNPDDFLEEVNRVLKPEGYFIISTPNLADIYSRITFLFGYTPFSYNPCKFRVGVPFSNINTNMDHKNVFTQRALEELLEVHNFEVIKKFGYSYSESFYLDIEPAKKKSDLVGFDGVRNFLDKILPSSLNEGLLFICKKVNVN